MTLVGFKEAAKDMGNVEKWRTSRYSRYEKARENGSRLLCWTFLMEFRVGLYFEIISSDDIS